MFSPTSETMTGWLVRLKAVIPKRLLRHLECLRALNGPARLEYVRLQFSDALRMASGAILRSRKVRRVIFVCHGNIIRSPMAEALLKREVNSRNCDLEVLSAGTHASAGRPADDRALAVAPEFGISLAQHQANAFTQNLIRARDVVVAMDYINAAELVCRFPGLREKVMLLPRAAGETGPVEVFDPYNGTTEDVRACYRILDLRIRTLADQCRMIASGKYKGQENT